MTTRMSDITIESEVLNKQETAKMLGMGVGLFDRKRKKLDKEHFPKFDELLNGWNRFAVRQWLDDRARSVRRLPQPVEERELEGWDDDKKRQTNGC